MTFLFVGSELNGCQQAVLSIQKATVGAIKLMVYLNSILIRDINFSPVGKMIHTKLMYRSSKKGKDYAVRKNKSIKGRESIFFLICVHVVTTDDIRCE